MAYLFRGTQSSRDEPQFSNFSTNPLSPQRNPNRLSTGMMSSNDARAGLTRRFTMNALPTLSPIGQQRRQAAGDGQMVSSISSTQKHMAQHIQHQNREDEIGGHGDMQKYGSEGIEELLMGSEPSPGLLSGSGKVHVSNGGQHRAGHKRGKSCWGAIGDGRPNPSEETENTQAGERGFYGFDSYRNIVVFWLTADGKPNGTYSRVAPSERRIRHIETLLEQQRRIAAELEQVDDETRREVEEGLRHERAVTQMIAQSEPTTPPEYHDAFSSVVSRPNRYSTASLASPPGVTSRPNRSSTHLTSPAANFSRPYTATNNSTLPSQSVPGSRRQSDDEEEEDDFIFGAYDSTIHRAAANPNRNSMPITSYDRKRNAADLSSTLGPLNTTSFLFDDDEKPSILSNKTSTKTSPPDIKTYLQVQHTADGFPKLIRRDDNGEQVSGSSAALDLALAKPTSEQQVTDRATASRHRISLPPSALSSNLNIAPLNSILANANDAKSAANNRRSMEVKFTAETKRPALMATPPRVVSNGVPKAQVSYSTNDIPTLKSINGEATSGGVLITSPSTQSSNIGDSTSEQSKGGISRMNSGTSSNITRQSLDFTSATTQAQENHGANYPTTQAGVQGAAAPLGMMPSQDSHQIQSYPSQNIAQYGQPAYYGGYGVNVLNNNLNNMNLNGGYGAQGQWPNQMPQYQQGGYSGYQQYSQNGQVTAGAGRYPDNQRATMQQRRQQADEVFNSASVAELVGTIYSLCKDQHGCRFLQRKLEEQKEQDIQIIFDEVKNHFSELMVDPFGNYLCQRLLEYANDDQRTVLVESAVPAMTRIALNQHGTRALQKMIEFISTQEQTYLIIDALRQDVVQLIQDLNGNHVIQKCLNHLSSEDSQFIFETVGSNCIAVGTHRHGCCVIQRCVDHATGAQKGRLVDSIIANAYSLVQDPFGNYVVQYIIDLAEQHFTEPLCLSFKGNVAFLSKQKFSSNVIEKCIRCASPEVRRVLIQEIMPSSEIEKLLRDNFANYVVQTAMDFADPETKPILFDNIRPIVPSIRHTPYGRRIQTKIQDFDNLGLSSLNLLPTNATVNNLPPPTGAHAVSAPYPSQGIPSGRGNRMGMVGPSPPWGNGMDGFNHPNGVGHFDGGGISAPVPQRNQAYSFLNGAQNYQNHAFGGQSFRQQPPYGHF